MKLVRFTQEHPPAVPPDNFYFWLRGDRVTTIATLFVPARAGMPDRFRTAIGDKIGKTWYVMETPEACAEAVNQALGGGVNEAKRGSD